jgi:acyl carrier protein
MYIDVIMEALKDHFGADKDFTPSTHFLDHLDGDEIDIVEVTVKVSEKLEIVIPEEDCFDIATVGDLIEVVGKQVNV